ncbi:MAG: hypothetical protein OEW00_06230 [candidate division Zixibacteria bacterium]|nr:hypothetical protein [candidate division Zixibacteria bacterium]
MRRLLSVFLLTGLLIVLSYQPAHAYLDPATGSYILQLVLAGLLGAALAVKIFWRNLRSFFGKLFSKGRDVGPDKE